MAIIRPCPKCQKPLNIPEPIPETIKCSACATVIRFKVPTAPPKEDPAPPVPAAVEAPKPKEPEPAAISEPAPPAKKSPKEPEPAAIAEGPPPAKKSEPAKSKPRAEAESSTGVLSYLHTVIPKPIVFGFYGALGGFLGVLLLGELFWLLHPTPQVVVPLHVKVSRDLIVYPGTSSIFQVKIKRQGFEGPVRVEKVSLPDGVRMPAVTIDAEKDEADVEIKTEEDAKTGTYEVKMRIASTTDAKLEVSEKLQLYLQDPPPTLRASVSPFVTVFAGGKTRNRFDFKVQRLRFADRNFEGRVRADVLEWPPGIDFEAVTLDKDKDQGTISVGAAKDAKVGAHALTMEVHSLDDHKVSFRKVFQLNVEPVPGNLRLNAPPQVTVFPGMKNRFTVKTLLQELKGPIEIEVSGAPRGVTFTTATIAADQSEAVIEVTADKNMKTGEPPAKDLRVHAKGPGGLTISVPLQLNINAPPPTVQLAVAPKVPVYPGGKASFGVKINRSRFASDVRLTVQVNAQYAPFLDFDKGPVTIAAGKTDAEMNVSVKPAALNLPLKQTMSVFVTASDVKGIAQPATEKVDIEILPPPSDLQLTVSPEVEVYQAGQSAFVVKIARSGFNGLVSVSFPNAPPGITIPVTAIFANDIIIKCQAGRDVEPKKYEIEVVGMGPKAPDGKMPKASQKFNLTVKPFDPSIRPPLDIVFVLDVTQSLDAQIAGVSQGIGQFLKGLRDRDLDARVGLLAFRDINYDNFPDFEKLKFNGELFTTDAKAFSAEVAKLKAQGGGDLPESSLDAIVKAANEYPFRAGAQKVFLLITDDKPTIKGNSVTMAITQKTLKAKKVDQVHLIVKAADRPHYQGLHDIANGGVKGGFFDFDQATKGGAKGGGFASILPMLSKEIAVTLGAPELKEKPAPVPEAAPQPVSLPAEKTPEPKAEANPTSPPPEVPQLPKAGDAEILRSADPGPPAADEVSAPRGEDAPTLQVVQSTHKYAEKDRIWLMIVNALWSAGLAAGIALTLVVAQKRYLSQSWLNFGEAGKGLAAGLVAGVVAGVISQWFFFTVTTGSGFWDFISRVLGWVLLGGLIGGSMGLFVPNMNWKRAFVGGCIGGFVGGLAFYLVEWLAGALLERYVGNTFVGVLSRLFGATLLGLFIGVMVAIAELASRRYWLEVSFGEREVRTVTLGSAAVAVGGDEKLVGVYVPNAPPKALGFRIDKNRVFCEDFTTGKTTEAAAGDQHTVANAKVKVCSGASATPTGANLQLVISRDVPLMVGMPLTADDIPGLEPQGSDGVVALVSRRPNNPKIYLLRNRSKQAWMVTEADGKQRKVDPGLSIELSSKCEIDFGQVKATLDPAAE